VILAARAPRLRGGGSTSRSQAVTMLILLLAANTSFADFPRLSFFLAREPLYPAPVRERR